jgi:RND family efflux transporter MFP subunit
MAEENKYRTLLRRIIISQVVIAALLVASGVGFVALSAQKPGVVSKEIVAAPLNIDSYSVRPVTFREIITAYGTAQPDREVVIAAQVSGEIVGIHPRLKIGQKVIAAQTIVSADEPTRYADGDVLVQLDQRDYANRVQQAKNRINETTRDIEQLRQQETNGERVLEKAKSDLVAFQQEHDRYRRAVKLNAGAKSELNRALVELNRHKDSILQMENQLNLYPHQIAAAKERLSSSEFEFQRAEDDLERTRVLPPFDGILSEIMAERGQYVRSGEPLVRLTDPGRIEVPVSIGLEDWRQVAASVNDGKVPEATLATSETSDGEWTGKITRVAPEADPGSRTIQVFVEVHNDQQGHELLPGTFVHARITGDQNTNQIVIPRATILNNHVFVISEDNTIQRLAVTQGRRLRSLVVITSGLTGTEKLAITNLTLLEDGLKVAVQGVTDLAHELEDQQYPLLQLVDSE